MQIGTADAAFVALQCAFSWINDLVRDSIFYAKVDVTLSCLQSKRARRQFG